MFLQTLVPRCMRPNNQLLIEHLLDVMKLSTSLVALLFAEY